MDVFDRSIATFGTASGRGKPTDLRCVRNRKTQAAETRRRRKLIDDEMDRNPGASVVSRKRFYETYRSSGPGDRPAGRMQSVSGGFFKHATVESDMCIHLMLEKDIVRRQKSESGLWLKKILQGSGLVRHKIWIESESFQIPSGDDLP
jgi:hypothetical protein